jgi:hypothetical protein
VSAELSTHCEVVARSLNQDASVPAAELRIEVRTIARAQHPFQQHHRPRRDGQHVSCHLIDAITIPEDQMGHKPSSNFQSNRPESGGADHNSQRENSGLLARNKKKFAAEHASEAHDESPAIRDGVERVGHLPDEPKE